MNGKQGMLTRLREEQRGVTTVVVVASLIGIFSAAVLSLGFGSAWAGRRVIVTATDGAALQQGRIAALTPANACSTTATINNYSEFLERNANDISFRNCELHADSAHPGTGYLLVEARKRAIAPFGGLFGIGETQPYSLSAVEYGFVTEPEGLRPMAFCDQNDHVEQWLAYQRWKNGIAGQQITETQYNALKATTALGVDVGTYDDFAVADADPFIDGPLDTKVDYPMSDATDGISTGGSNVSYASYGVVHRMYYTKSNPSDCNADGDSVPGNWGWMDFDGDENSSADEKDWITNGYDGQAGVNDCDADYNPGPPISGEQGDPCEGNPGLSGGSGKDELQTLVTNQTVFAIPIFSDVDPGCGGGGGSCARYTISGFILLRLRGFQVTGTGDNYFDFEFVDAVTSGACCAKTPTNPGGPKGIRICAVDHDGDTSDAVIRARCGQQTTIGP